MVIGPNELEQKINETYKTKIAEAEERIDDILVKRYDGVSVTIDSSIVSQGNSIVSKKILGKYRSAGWDITHHSDQRDGDFYTFKKETSSINSSSSQYDSFATQYDR